MNLRFSFGDGPPALRLLEGDVDRQIAQLPAGIDFQLIYWDPPFYSRKHHVGPNGRFTDRWPSLEEYLAAIRRDFPLMLERLAASGFFVLHCDWHASHYLKVLGDELLGYENFRNELVWHYTGRRQPARIRLNAKHDVLLIWAKSSQAQMAPLFEPWSRERYIAMKRQQLHRDADGREWIWGHRGKGQSHAYKIYLDEAVGRGRARDDVWEFPIINTSSRERLGYPTQKPVQLLKALVSLLTRPGDRVGDFMAGSGTAGAAALELGRNAVLGDNNPDAISLIRQRLEDWLEVPELRRESAVMFDD